MARGDVLFYYSSGTAADVAIVAATGGPFVHAEVDLGDGTSIGALSGGTAHFRRASGARYAVYPTAEHCTQEQLAAGLAWLSAQVGDPYGWADILTASENAAARGLAGIFGRPAPALPYLAVPGAYDCSDLVCQYLTRCAIALPPSDRDPHTVTPEALATQLGVRPSAPVPTPAALLAHS